jgi:uncharacterized protein (TIGR03435 family)
MTLRLPILVLASAATVLLGQADLPGLFGKITARPKAGDLAPDLTFTKVLHAGGSTAWTADKLYGRVTVLQFLPYVSGNPDVVKKWNALVTQFKGEPIQFVWIAAEDETTLLPFLKDHPIEGWMFLDPNKETGRAYGLETPEPVIIGADHRILGFDGGMVPSEELLNAVLGERITTTPPKPTREGLRAFAESGRLLLSAEAHPMPRFEDKRPSFTPSYTVHIERARNESGGGNFSAPDYWSLQGYTVKGLLAEMLDVNPIRIELPASVDSMARYDFSIVLPKSEDKDAMRLLMRQGVEDYFQLTSTRENKLRDVYVLTGTADKLRKSAVDRREGGNFSSSMSFEANAKDVAGDGEYKIDAVTGISTKGATVDEFCRLLERNLDRPLLNESKIAGVFDFEISELDPGAKPPRRGDFVERVRQELGLLIAADQRNVETTVYRLR